MKTKNNDQAHGATEEISPSMQILATLETQGAARAVEVGKDLLQKNYFDTATREALAQAYRGCNRDEEARRLLPGPVKPSNPKSLKMVSQSDPELESRVLAAGSDYPDIPPVSIRDNGRSFKLRTPLNFQDLPEKVQQHPEFKHRDITIELPGSRTVAFPNARYSANGTFVTRDFEVINTNRVGHHKLSGVYFAPGLGWHVDLDDEPDDLGEPVFLFQRHPMANYYHFIMEQVCHLLTWKEVFEPKGIKVLLRRNNFLDLTLQMLEFLEIDTQKVLFTDAAYMTAPLLIKPDVAMHTETRGTFVTAATLDYFDFAVDNYRGGNRGSTPKRIFISRKDVPKRGLLNEAELVETLKKFGFEEVVLSGMTIDEQVELFSNAEAVVAGHGAGLTNIGYCRPGTFVLEITKTFTLDRVRIFWELAAARDLNFAVVCAEDDQKDHSTSFAAPIEEVSECLAKHLG